MLEVFVLLVGFALLAAVRAHIEVRECGDPALYHVLCIVLLVVATILSASM